MTIARSIRLKSRPQGAASHENFEMTRDELPDPGEGEFLVRILWLSLDPYMRGRMNAGKSYTPPVRAVAILPAQAVGGSVQAGHGPSREAKTALAALK